MTTIAEHPRLDDHELPDPLVDAFAQLIWMRLKPYLALGPSARAGIWMCDFGDLPDMSKAPLRLAARDVLKATIVGSGVH